MSKQKRFTAEEKVMILRKHFEKNIPISDLAEEYSLNPNVIYLWKKQLFENAAEIFERKSSKHERESSKALQKIEQLETKLAGRENLISDLVTDLIGTKKKYFGEL